ncbi:hypothetical protein DdX_15505 [Ditylenchus destructor]|uniref:Uncharacterized protein n=1 Tax=Ditylenchus destructor TaxID=166010 RepID=A0AAD4MPE0_9BILA|nr:hypothetical protein DdX_15505 [Ditylenchus destructor]
MTRLCEIISAITSNEVNCITKVPTPADRKRCKEPVPPNPAVPQNAAFQLADNEYFDNEFNDDEEDERTLACKRNPYRWDCPQFKKNVIPGGTF